MVKGFSNRPEDQADAHPAAEEHGKPGKIVIFRFVFFFAQFDFAVSAEGHVKAKAEEESDAGHVHPACVVDGPFQGSTGDGTQTLVIDKAPDCKSDTDNRGNNKDQWIHTPEESPIAGLRFNCPGCKINFPFFHVTILLLIS